MQWGINGCPPSKQIWLCDYVIENLKSVVYCRYGREYLKSFPRNDDVAIGSYKINVENLILQKLKHQENIRLRQEQLERDIQMVAKGEALMRMKQRQEMEENLAAMAEAERRRDEAMDREARAEQLLAEAEEARDSAQVKQADAEAMQFALQARLTASRKEGENLGARIAELERALASAVEE